MADKYEVLKRVYERLLERQKRGELFEPLDPTICRPEDEHENEFAAYIKKHIGIDSSVKNGLRQWISAHSFEELVEAVRLATEAAKVEENK